MGLKAWGVKENMGTYRKNEYVSQNSWQHVEHAAGFTQIAIEHDNPGVTDLVLVGFEHVGAGDVECGH
jgi:hypothetical protein